MDIHEETLKIARNLMEKDPGLTDWVISKFPELAESKDERMRKELIEYIKDQQSSFISAPDCRDKYEEEENNKYNSWIAWLQGEQKPADKVESNLLTHERAMEISPFMRTGFEKKPAEWSEEDEGFLKLLLAIFTNEHPNGIFSTDNITAFKGNCVASNRIIAWLKSLKDRYTWKPSKEQMEYLHKYAEQNNYDGAILTLLYNDLKQL